MHLAVRSAKKSVSSPSICLCNIRITKYCEKLSVFNNINKNLKFKKGVGIAIKSKETSSKLAI